jgi:hypothetical protein
VLEIVEDEQHVPFAQVVEELLLGISFAVQLQREDIDDGRDDVFG